MKNDKNSYLNFDKHRMVNLEYSLHREILIANRRGAYHATSLSECNTRKQHGLLVVPVPQFDNTNHVLISSLDETIIQYGAEFNMGINKFDGNNFAPQGHKYIREFSCENGLKTIYRVGGVVFSKEKMFSLVNNTIYIRYKLLEAHSPTKIRFKPLLAFRDVNSLTGENFELNHGYKTETNGISMCLYSGYPTLHMQFNEKPDFVFSPQWYKGVEYLKDQEAELPYKEDLYQPGYFELPFEKGQTIVFVASDAPIETNKLNEAFDHGLSIRTKRDSFENCLRNASHQLIYRPNSNETFILNGYPWGIVDARNQFLSLEGLTINNGDVKNCKDVIDTSIPILTDFMRYNKEHPIMKNIDVPDALLWFLYTVDRCSSYDLNQFEEKHKIIALEVLEYILANKHPNLHFDKNGLVSVDGRSKPASWMDGMINGQVVVPRSGYLVEINALWYDSLKFGAKVALKFNDENSYDKYENLANIVKQSFIETFVNEHGYLFDYVENGIPDYSVRPNMLTPIASKYHLLDKRTIKIALDFMTRELVTFKGLRTKSPKGGGYVGRYEGTKEEKAYAAFNGVARLWLLAPYFETYLSVFQKSGVAIMDRFFASIEQEMSNDCIGTLSEMYDGSMPAWGHGMISSGIDIAGVLNMIRLKKKYLNSNN